MGLPIAWRPAAFSASTWHTPAAGWLSSALALAGLFRDVKQTRSVEDWKLKEFKVEVRQKRAIPVAFDGEVSTLRSPLLFRKRVGDLRVIVPLPEPPAPT